MAPSEESELVKVPARDGKQREVSLQVFQDVYAHLTGRSETLSRRYESPFQVGFAEIQDVHLKLEQILEQYHVSQSTASFKVTHIDGTSHTHGNWEHFETLRRQYTCAIEQLEIEYNFLIVLPKVQSPQPYKIRVQIVSAVGVNERFQKEFANGPKVFRLLWGPPVMVNIKYVDYAVARSVLGVLDEWSKGLKTDSIGPKVRKAQQWSGAFSNLVCYSLTGIGFYLAWRSLVGFEQSPSGEEIAGLVLLALGLVWGINRVGLHVGRMAESAIDSWQLLSYVRLTSGDDRQIEKASKRNKVTIAKVIGSLLLGVIASVVANFITKDLFS